MSEEIVQPVEPAPREPAGSRPASSVGVAGPTGYRGNTNDVIALSAAVSGLSLCGYLATNGLFCCFPVLLGVAGLVLAKDAQDPIRARNLSLVGIVSAGLLIALFLACFVAYFAFIAFIGLTSSGGAFNWSLGPN